MAQRPIAGMVLSGSARVPAELGLRSRVQAVVIADEHGIVVAGHQS